MNTRSPIKLFISYSRADSHYKDALLRHLNVLRDRGYCEWWDDSMIELGQEWDSEVKIALSEADIVLYLISSNSLSSDYINGIELAVTLERIKNEEVYLVPIILERCMWDETSFKDYQVAPKNGKPIAEWENTSAAYDNVARKLKSLITAINNLSQIHDDSIFSLRPLAETEKVTSKLQDKVVISLEKTLSMENRYWTNLEEKTPKWEDSFAACFCKSLNQKIAFLSKRVDSIDVKGITYKREVREIRDQVEFQADNLRKLLLESESSDCLLYIRTISLLKSIKKLDKLIYDNYGRDHSSINNIHFNGMIPIKHGLDLLQDEIEKIYKIAVRAMNN